MIILGLILIFVAGLLHSWYSGNTGRPENTSLAFSAFGPVVLLVSIVLLIAGAATVWAGAGVLTALGCVAGYFLVLPLVFIPILESVHLIPAQGQHAQADPLYKRSLTINEKALGPDHPAVATSLNNLAEKLAFQKTAGQSTQDVKRYDPYARYETGDVIYKEYDETLTVGSKNVEHFRGAVILKVVGKTYYRAFNCEMLEVDYAGGGVFRKYIDYMKKTRTQVLLPSKTEARGLVPEVMAQNRGVLAETTAKTQEDKMGWFKLLLNAWDARNAEGCRKAMRKSYKKHLRLALQGMNPSDSKPHEVGLYGALGTRYMSFGIPVTPSMELAITAELVPFLLMKETDAVEALAEYIVYKEVPREAKMSWLRKLINDALRTASPEDFPRIMAPVSMIHQVAWCNLLDQDIKSTIEKETEKYSIFEDVAAMDTAIIVNTIAAKAGLPEEMGIVGSVLKGMRRRV